MRHRQWLENYPLATPSDIQRFITAGEPPQLVGGGLRLCQELGTHPIPADHSWVKEYTRFILYLDHMRQGLPFPSGEYGAHVSALHGWHAHGVWACGNHQFQLSTALCEKMLLTTFHGTWEDLRLPYPHTCLIVPPIIRMHDPQTGWHTLETIYLAYAPEIQQFRMFLVALPNENSGDPWDDCVAQTGFHLNKDLQEEIQRVGQYAIPVGFQKVEGLGFADVLRMILNCILYINARPEDIRQDPLPPKYFDLKARVKGLTGRKKERAVQRIKEYESVERPFVVGRSIKIQKELREAARKAGQTWKLEVTSYVRGHWRNQACGPEHQLRKLIWIEPHYRGLDQPVATQHTYLV